MKNKKNIYIASYEENGGIYVCGTDGEGRFEIKDKILLDRPMYLTIADNKMYALLREIGIDQQSGMCTFEIGADGRLSHRSNVISTMGEVACHICVSGTDVYAANYISGSIIHFPDQVVIHEGSGRNSERQQSPHAHFVGITPDDKYICAADLGLDKVMFYDRELNYQFQVGVPDGYGARHCAFSEDGKYMYCVNEIVSSVTVFRYRGKDTIALRTYDALPKDYQKHNQAAAIRVYKNRVYVSNRGHDSIAVFEIFGEKLELIDFISTGREPRDFNIIDDVLVCCNMLDDNVTFYLLNDQNRKVLTLPIKKPLCVIAK